ncbi:MAG: sigma-70 family RNA polymerase sigma factor, partial [Planctomycetota bacterium]
RASRRLDHFASEFSDGDWEPRDEHARSVRVFVWIRLIITQTLIDTHRRHLGAQMRDAGRELVLDAPSSPFAADVSLVHELIGQLSSPSQAAANKELSEQLNQALAKMGRIDREIIALRHFEEMANVDAAKALSISPKTASIRYVRAIRRLKEVLSSMPGFESAASPPGH